MTWVAYAMLAWFAYLQASPGLVVPHLRDELHMSYSAGGLHVAAFAAGSLIAGLVSARAERTTGRKRLFWLDRKSTRLNSSHMSISYAVFCLKKKNNT